MIRKSKISNALKPLDIGNLMKEKIDRDNISFVVVSEAIGIPAKRVELIYRKKTRLLVF